MDELTVKLFEEAHEMVRVEKQARHLAEKRATESQSKLDVRRGAGGVACAAAAAAAGSLTADNDGGGGFGR